MSRHSHYSRLVLATLALGTIASTAAAQGRGAGRGANAPMINASTDPLLAHFRFRQIGPASMGGRIDDIEVSASNPNIIWVGYAVGGAFKSENNGTSFTPVFQTYTTASIGDIAIHPTNPDIVYVGTGEPNNRQTSSFGDGLYKTTDGGKTFTKMGLTETQTIARIVIDPKNPEVVYVASPGHLFGPSPDRGVFKSADGGKSWIKLKYVDDNTGFNDIAMDASNSAVLYASSYQRRRTSCCFNGGGPGSAVWKSTDAGASWNKLSGNGLPPGTYGRIALDVSRSNPTVVYAQIEAGETGTPVIARGAGPGAGRGAPGAVAAPGAESDVPGGGRGGFDWCNNGGPTHGFTAGRGGGGGGRGGEIDTNRTPPAMEAGRGGIFRSADAGKTWTQMGNCNARPMYFSQLRVDPSNENTIYVSGLPIARSVDAGKTFNTLDNTGGFGDAAHVDNHAIWVDPKNPNHVMIGNDGGLDVTWDGAKSWDYINTMATGLAYVVTADMGHPYYVYTGLQDNGSWGGPGAVRPSGGGGGGGGGGGIYNSDWFRIGGGDGFYTAADPTDFHIIYSESQDGNTNRIDLASGRQEAIRPRGNPAAVCGGRGGGGGGGGGGRGGPPPAATVINAGPNDCYRFNWNTPYILSPHNSSIVWYGGNRLFKSYDRGDHWVASADLTKQVDRNLTPVMGVGGDKTQLSKNDGHTQYSTIITVSESPVMPGIVWAGTDDGNLQVSHDGGVTFTDVTKNLPGIPATPNYNYYWVSRVDASHFDSATAYVAVDGHRSDDLKPYVFVTHDFGKTFTYIGAGLPPYGNVQVVKEDPKNKNLLYVGTEFGLYISLDAGKTWQKFMNNYPTVRTDDILIHPRDGDVIVATHGRSVWIADDVTPLQQLTDSVRAKDVNLFDIRPATAYLPDRRRGQVIGGQKVYVGENAARGTAISYYLKAAAQDVKLAITDVNGKVVRDLTGTKDAGINRVEWNLTPNPPEGGRGGRGGGGGGFGGGGGIEPGTYIVTLTVDGKTFTKPVVVQEDRWMFER